MAVAPIAAMVVMFRIIAIATTVVLAGTIAHAQSALVSWDPSPDSSVSYVVSYGTQPRAVRPYTTSVEVGQKPQWTFTPPSATDAYYFAVQTKDPTGSVSGYSREVLLEPMARVSVSRAEGDLNADGQADLLWHNQQSGVLQAWLMRDTKLEKSAAISAVAMSDTNWKVVGMGDFTGDGAADLVWQNQSTELVAIWAMNGTTYVRSESPAANGVAQKNWTIRAVGDMSGDGKPDVIWQNRTNGQVAVWVMNGTQYAKSVAVQGQAGDKDAWVVGAGDFDGDRRSDLVWYNEKTGAVSYWLMDGTTFLASAQTFPADTISDTNWTVRAVADLNGDRKPDLVWQHKSSGLLAAWLMNGTTIMRVAPLNPGHIDDLNWNIAAPR